MQLFYRSALGICTLVDQRGGGGAWGGGPEPGGPEPGEGGPEFRGDLAAFHFVTRKGTLKRLRNFPVVL